MQINDTIYTSHLRILCWVTIGICLIIIAKHLLEAHGIRVGIKIMRGVPSDLPTKSAGNTFQLHAPLDENGRKNPVFVQKTAALLHELPEEYCRRMERDITIAQCEAMITARVRWYLDTHKYEQVENAEIVAYAVSAALLDSFVSSSQDLMQPAAWDARIAAGVEEYLQAEAEFNENLEQELREDMR